MKILFSCLFLLIAELHAQENQCKQNFIDIAALEQKRFTSSNNDLTKTFASSNFSIYYSRCIWKVDPAVRYIEGRVTSYITASASTNSITFDLSNSLAVDSVLFRNQKIGFTQNANSTLDLQLSATLNANHKDSVTICYKGIPGNTGFGSFIQTTHNNTPVIWTLSEPYGARDWWPCRNGLDDKVDSIDVFIVHPTQYKATSNGLLQSEITAGPTTTTFFKHRYPIASYLVCFSVTNFSVFTNSVQLGNVNLPVVTYVYPESINDFQPFTYKVLDAMQLFHNTFAPYPFIKEKYGHTQFGWGGGMEHQTNTFLINTDANLMAHELGHQWFGNKITCGSWQDIWLNESFATFCANYYAEKFDTSFFQLILTNHLAQITSLPDGSVIVDDTTSVNRIFNSRLSYNKGAYVLRMLRFTLGDSLFFRGIRQYQNDAVLQYSYARTADFKRNMEQASGKDLTYFFDQWITGQGYPSFQIQWRQNKNNWANIKVYETTSHSSVPFFKTPLTLTFKNASQQKRIVIQVNSNGAETWAYIGFAADTVLIDTEKQLISKNNTSTKIKSSNTTINEIKLYPNPVHDNLYISLKNPSDKKLTVQIYNSVAQLVAQQQFDTIGQDELLQLAFSPFPKGNYIVKVNGGNSTLLIKKIVK
jgi:aminopeptidase N